MLEQSEARLLYDVVNRSLKVRLCYNLGMQKEEKRKQKVGELLQNGISKNKAIKPKNNVSITPRGMRERKRIKNQRKFIENYRITHGNKTKASKLTGISLQTVMKWQRNTKFLKELENIEAELIDKAEETLYTRGVEKSDTALIEFLRANHPKYKRKTDNSIQINNIVPILQGDTKKNIIEGTIKEGKVK